MIQEQDAGRDPRAVEGEPEYAVVRNAEEQYSIWRNDAQLPRGWEREGMSGTREACLEHIERVWTDMRPRSVRERMARQGTSQS